MVTEKNSRAKRELNKVQAKTKGQKLNLKDKIDLSKNNCNNKCILSVENIFF